MIEGSIFIDELPNNKNHDKYDSYRYYVCGLKIDGVDYTAKIVVGVKGDSKYYDHRLTEIEKGSLIDNLNGLSNSVADNQDSLVSVSKDTKLKELLQINSSKVVDANGEPMVVYHGTPNQFSTFNRELIGSSTDRGIWGRGFYFTSNKAEAERYTKRSDATGEVKEVFLNIRKPLAIKAEQGDAGKEYIQSLYRRHVTDEIFEDPRTTDAKLAEATQKVTDELVENGYDGVVVTYKDGTQEYQAGPRQAILWDLANGAIKLRWDNATTDSGAVQRGLQAELGVRGTEERRAYKAVIDNKNGQSVDAYVHDLWQNGEWGQEISTEELKDELLGVLQSTPNGSLALKELADMSGAQADLEAQISLGKGDIQRKLEEVDANLAKNAQQMADFRKRINDTVQKLENGEPMAKEQPSNRLTEQQASDIIRAMQVNAEVAREIELTPGNWRAEFGEDNIVKTPIGEVKMGEHQYFKLLERQREGYFGMIKPTLANPDIVLEESAPEPNAERDSKYLFVKTFVKNDGSRYVHFESVTVQKDSKEVSISSHEIDQKGLLKKMHNDNVVHLKDSFLDSEWRLTEPSELKGSDLVPTPNSSESKGTTTIPKNQISEEEIFNTPTLPTNEDIPFMIEQKTADKGVVSETEQNFEREVFDAFAGHLGETLGAESVVTDAAEANRVLEWHQGESPTL